MNYKQCRLYKDLGTGKYKVQFAWIPETFAKLGHILMLGKDDGWKVDAVFATAAEEEIIARERDYKHWHIIRGLEK